MVKLRIIAVGKDKDLWVSQGCEHFKKLLKRFARTDLTVVPAAKGTASPQDIMKKEAGRISKELRTGVTVALTDSGRKLDSLEFSQWLEKTIDSSGGTVNFIIGGAFGLHDSVLESSDHRISLSRLTFSHQVVRLVLLEQIYRAFSISNRTDYHK